MDDSRAPEPSGDFSRDPTFDPNELFDVIGREDNSDRVFASMRQFIKRADASLFERAVAIFVRSARARGEPVEVVLATLEQLADELERDATPGFAGRDTSMRHLVMRGVLLAFYGSEVVEHEAAARAERVERRARSRSEGA